MNFTYLLRHPKIFPSVIGITHKRFEQIFKKFERELERSEIERAFGKERIKKFITPYKKPPKKELSNFQKQNNKEISSIRVRVEYPFAWINFPQPNGWGFNRSKSLKDLSINFSQKILWNNYIPRPNGRRFK